MQAESIPGLLKSLKIPPLLPGDIVFIDDVIGFSSNQIYFSFAYARKRLLQLDEIIVVYCSL